MSDWNISSKSIDKFIERVDLAQDIWDEGVVMILLDHPSYGVDVLVSDDPLYELAQGYIPLGLLKEIISNYPNIREECAKFLEGEGYDITIG